MNHPIRVLGLDPSTTATGVAVFDIIVDDETGKYIVKAITTQCIKPKSLNSMKFLPPENNITGPVYSKYRIDLTLSKLDSLLAEIQPDVIYSEIPHIDVKHLNNVYTLAYLKVRIEELINSYEIPHIQLNATSAKKVIGANLRKGREGMTSKQRVLDDLNKVKVITKRINLFAITEDEIDAVLLAYAGIFGVGISTTRVN